MLGRHVWAKCRLLAIIIVSCVSVLSAVQTVEENRLEDELDQALKVVYPDELQPNGKLLLVGERIKKIQEIGQLFGAKLEEIQKAVVEMHNEEISKEVQKLQIAESELKEKMASLEAIKKILSGKIDPKNIREVELAVKAVSDLEVKIGKLRTVLVVIAGVGIIGSTVLSAIGVTFPAALGTFGIAAAAALSIAGRIAVVCMLAIEIILLVRKLDISHIQDQEIKGRLVEYNKMLLDMEVRIQNLRKGVDTAIQKVETVKKDMESGAAKAAAKAAEVKAALSKVSDEVTGFFRSKFSNLTKKLNNNPSDLHSIALGSAK